MTMSPRGQHPKSRTPFESRRARDRKRRERKTESEREGERKERESNRVGENTQPRHLTTRKHVMHAKHRICSFCELGLCSYASALISVSIVKNCPCHAANPGRPPRSVLVFPFGAARRSEERS